jgi:hypothetical protein
MKLMSAKKKAVANVDLHVKCLNSLPGFNQNWNISSNLLANPNIKIHENLSGGIQFVPCGEQTEGQI